MKGSVLVLRGADFQSAVSRVSNPLDVENTVDFSQRPARCRLEVGDTADWKSALPNE
jgi:hypothetical protein